MMADLGYPLTTDQLRQRLREIRAEKDNTVLVARLDGIAVGLIHVARLVSLVAEPRAEIRALVVDESVRGKGIGKQLIGAAESWASDHGMKKLRLGTRIHRLEAHAFYEHLGFSLAKEHKIYEKPVGLAESA